MKYFIYCDESGEASFSDNSTQRYFAACTLTISDDKKNKIKNTMKRKKAKLYNLGWPKQIEIKASVLHSLKFNKNIPQMVKNKIDGDEFIKEILNSVKYFCAPRIDYMVVRKYGMTDLDFKNAPYGIAYNYFAGKILIPLIVAYGDCFLTVDRRNKEMHNQRHFDGYIETAVRGNAFEKKIKINLEIEHADSMNNYGLQAVDFFSWSIYRKATCKDMRFFDIFKELICGKNEWYCDK